jgi:hypothetical protein
MVAKTGFVPPVNLRSESASDLFTNLETFSTIIDFQKKCYGKYTPKAVFCGWFIYTKYHTNVRCHTKGENSKK